MRLNDCPIFLTAEVLEFWGDSLTIHHDPPMEHD
jgi:hypothetical protein